VKKAPSRVKSLGGAVLQEPMEVPNGEWVVQCKDPQGVNISLVAPKP